MVGHIPSFPTPFPPLLSYFPSPSLPPSFLSPSPLPPSSLSPSSLPPLPSHSKPGESVSQVLLLSVRRRWRSLGVGGYLLRLCKDPSIAGQYDMLLAYADHKAESFFTRHGFTDDPIVTARHKYLLHPHVHTCISLMYMYMHTLYP